MDLYCRHCGEPWAHDCLHDEAQSSDRTYADVSADFRERGCKAFTSYGTHRDCQPRPSERTAAAGAMYELLGDDMDAAAAMLEDIFG